MTGAESPTVLVAALGRQMMLNVAGRLAEGTLLWMVSPRRSLPTSSHLTAAADAAGRGCRQVVVSLRVCVTSGPDGARETTSSSYASYGELPSGLARADARPLFAVRLCER